MYYPNDIDLDVLNENFDKLHFVNGVAIYFDKNKTHRDTFDEFSNFDDWLKIYSNQHQIEPFSFRALIKGLVNDVHKELLSPFEADKLFSIPENFMDKLNSIKKVGLAGDPYSYHTVLSLIWRYLPIENNYTLICQDGSYLMSKNFEYTPFYYNNVKINKHGIFKCERRFYGYDNCFPGSVETENRLIYWDSQGHCLWNDDFELFLKLIQNCAEGPINILKELNDCNFKVVGPKSNRWSQKEGGKNIRWGEERDDGLTFYKTEYRRTGSSVYHEKERVRDNYDNKMSLNDFYTGLKMLQNGKKYLSKL